MSNNITYQNLFLQELEDCPSGLSPKIKIIGHQLLSSGSVILFFTTVCEDDGGIITPPPPINPPLPPPPPTLPPCNDRTFLPVGYHSSSIDLACQNYSSRNIYYNSWNENKMYNSADCNNFIFPPNGYYSYFATIGGQSKLGTILIINGIRSQWVLCETEIEPCAFLITVTDKADTPTELPGSCSFTIEVNRSEPPPITLNPCTFTIEVTDLAEEPIPLYCGLTVTVKDLTIIKPPGPIECDFIINVKDFTRAPYIQEINEQQTSSLIKVMNADKLSAAITWELVNPQNIVINSGFQSIGTLGVISLNLTNLTSNTQYLFRSFAIALNKNISSISSQEFLTLPICDFSIVVTDTSLEFATIPLTRVKGETTSSVEFEIQNADVDNANISWQIREGSIDGAIVNSGTINNSSSNVWNTVSYTSAISNTIYYLTGVRATIEGKTISGFATIRNTTTLAICTLSITVTDQALDTTITPFTRIDGQTSTSVSFSIQNRDIDNANIIWQIREGTSNGAIVHSGTITNAIFDQWNQVVFSSALSNTTYYLTQVIATASGKNSSTSAIIRNTTTDAICTFEIIVTDKTEEIEITTTTTLATTFKPTTGVVGFTESSVTFSIMNTDAATANIAYKIRPGGPTNTPLVNTTISVGSSNTVNVSYNNASSGTTYYLTDVIATANNKNSSVPGDQQSITTATTTSTTTIPPLPLISNSVPSCPSKGSFTSTFSSGTSSYSRAAISTNLGAVVGLLDTDFVIVSGNTQAWSNLNNGTYYVAVRDSAGTNNVQTTGVVINCTTVTPSVQGTAQTSSSVTFTVTNNDNFAGTVTWTQSWGAGSGSASINGNGTYNIVGNGLNPETSYSVTNVRVTVAGKNQSGAVSASYSTTCSTSIGTFYLNSPTNGGYGTILQASSPTASNIVYSNTANLFDFRITAPITTISTNTLMCNGSRFNGGSNYFGISETIGGVPTKVIRINSVGEVIAIENIQTTTTTTTEAPIVITHSSIVCSGTNVSWLSSFSGSSGVYQQTAWGSSPANAAEMLANTPINVSGSNHQFNNIPVPNNGTGTIYVALKTSTVTSYVEVNNVITPNCTTTTTTTTTTLATTFTPGTAVAGQTTSSVTFNITNTDAVTANIDWQIRVDSTGGQVMASGPNLGVPPSGTQNVSFNSATSGVTYFLTGVIATATNKLASAAGTVRSTAAATTTTTTTLPPLSISNTGVTCSGEFGSWTSTFSGGTGSYTRTAIGFSTANAATNIDNDFINSPGTTYQWTNIPNSPSGVYYVAVRDSNGTTYVNPNAVAFNCIAPTTTTTTLATTATPTITNISASTSAVSFIVNNQDNTTATLYWAVKQNGVSVPGGEGNTPNANANGGSTVVVVEGLSASTAYTVEAVALGTNKLLSATAGPTGFSTSATTTTTTTLVPITISNSAVTCSVGTGSFTSTFGGGSGSYSRAAISTDLSAVAGLLDTNFVSVVGSSHTWTGLANGNYYVAVRDSVGTDQVQTNGRNVIC